MREVLFLQVGVRNRTSGGANGLLQVPGADFFHELSLTKQVYLADNMMICHENGFFRD